MRKRIGMGAILLAACLALPLAAQQEERPKLDRPLPPAARERIKERAEERQLTPEQREKLKEQMRIRAEEAREKGEERGDPGARAAFIIGFLQNQPEYRAAVQKHNENMKKIQQQLAESRKVTVENLREAPNPAARRAVIEEAREGSAKLLEQLVDEAIRHHEEIAELTKTNRDQIVENALNNIYRVPREREEVPRQKD